VYRKKIWFIFLVGIVFTSAPFAVRAKQISSTPNTANVTVATFGVYNGLNPLDNDAPGVIEITGAGTLSNNSGAVLNNNSGGMLNIDPPGGGFLDTFGGTLNNSGTLNNNSGGTLNNSGNLNNNSNGTLNNYGVLTTYSGANLINYGGTLNNYGTLTNSGILDNMGSLTNYLGGILTNNSGGTLTNSATLTNSGTLYNYGTINGIGTFTQTAGLFENNGTATQASFNISSGGTLSGTGTLNGTVNLASGATIMPGDAPGTLTINGDLNSSGILDFLIDGTDPSLYSSLIVTGTATFSGGAIDLGFINGFVPTAGETFDFLTAASINGWDTLAFNVTGLGSGLVGEIEPITGGEELLITQTQSVPEPPAILYLVLSLTAVGAGMKFRRGRLV
jgi:hypothetical protein